MVSEALGEIGEAIGYEKLLKVFIEDGERFIQTIKNYLPKTLTPS